LNSSLLLLSVWSPGGRRPAVYPEGFAAAHRRQPKEEVLRGERCGAAGAGGRAAGGHAGADAGGSEGAQLTTQLITDQYVQDVEERTHYYYYYYYYYY